MIIEVAHRFGLRALETSSLFMSLGHTRAMEFPLLQFQQFPSASMLYQLRNILHSKSIIWIHLLHTINCVNCNCMQRH